MSQSWLFTDTGDDRDKRCKRLVERCGYGAAALTILPIPGSEIVGVMPLHVAMIIGVGEIYGVDVTRASAADLVVQIGSTVGLSLVGSHLAITAGKILLPGLGGLVAAPFMFASTMALGAVARAYFLGGNKLVEHEVRGIYEDTVKRAKDAFDPARAKSDEAKSIADDAAAQGRKEAPPADAPAATAHPRPSVDELADRLAD